MTSGDESTLPTFFQNQQAKFESSNKAEALDEASLNEPQKVDDNDKSRLATPMMAIPATRRIGNSANRQSLVLNIETTATQSSKFFKIFEIRIGEWAASILEP